MTSRPFRRWPAALMIVWALAGAGCAASQPAPNGDDRGGAPERAAIDPIEPLNRAVFGFNEAIDQAIVRPVARAYDDYTPEVVRLIARNFLSNLLDPYIALNNFLQGKPAQRLRVRSRFFATATRTAVE